MFWGGKPMTNSKLCDIDNSDMPWSFKWMHRAIVQKEFKHFPKNDVFVYAGQCSIIFSDEN